MPNFIVNLIIPFDGVYAGPDIKDAALEKTRDLLADNYTSEELSAKLTIGFIKETEERADDD